MKTKVPAISTIVCCNSEEPHNLRHPSDSIASLPLVTMKTMSGKPVLEREAKTVLTLGSKAFHEKALCDGITLNPGDACAYSCSFCYVEQQMRKLLYGIIDAYNEEHGTSLAHGDFVIRRKHSLRLLHGQLFDGKGRPKYDDPEDNRVVYSSTLVDVGANMELLRETAEACTLILDNTHWQIRLLSKGNLLPFLVKRGLIPDRRKEGNKHSHHRRIIFGFSTGTLDDRLAAAFERGTALVSKRIEALHWLQDHGFRTFGMICPSLPQLDYNTWSRDICQALRVERLEHVWAEVINVRGPSFTNTFNALMAAGFKVEADMLAAVSGGCPAAMAWEQYARSTFEAHARHVSPDKLRFLQYVDSTNADYWESRREDGALLLGKYAQDHSLCTVAHSAPASFYPKS